MAITALHESSATISTTEYSLPSASTTRVAQTSDGVFQAFVDLSAMTATETYTIKVYEKVEAAGTQRLVETWTVSGVQASPHWVSPSLILMHGWDITMTKTAGTDRSIAWSIRQVA